MKKFKIALLALLTALAIPAHAAKFADGQLIDNVTATATAAGTTTLTVSSAHYQVFTGSTTQNCKLPNATTLRNGVSYVVTNESSGAVTLQYNDASTAGTIPAGGFVSAILRSNGTSNGTWSLMSVSGGSGTVTSIAVTVPSFLSVSGSPITSSGTFGLTLSGTALPLSSGGLGLTSGTSGGILGFTASGTLASSALLTSNQLIVGGGAGATPLTLAAGSQYQSLVMGASNPGYGAVNLGQAAAITGTAPIGNGGTGVTSVTTAPAASTFAGWDANSNLSANNHIDGYATTTTAAGTTTFTVGSAGIQYFTGATTQTAKLPVTSTLVVGHKFKIVNLSSGSVTLQSSGANTLQAMAQNTQLVATCISTSGTGTASWDWTYQAVQNSIGGGGTVSSVTFTGDGTVLSSTPSSAVTTSGTVTGALANAGAGTYLGGPYSGSAAAWAAKTFQAPTIQKFLSTGTTTGYLFTVSGVTTAPTAGATYTNNGNTYTVSATNTGKTLIWATQAAAPLASGTLTKTAGTGDATITFSANVALATYTTATGTLYVRARLVGAGGGGSGSGTGAPGSGGTGGTTAFGSALLVTTGGVGGTTSGYGGAGGTASLGTAVGTALTGGIGNGLAGSASTGSVGGMGAASYFGGAGGAGYAGGAVGKDAAANTGSGGGGAGVSATGSNSGTGGGAGGFIDAIITSPSATYLYTIGAGGTAGTLGTNGQAGGAGGSGYVEITEYYQ